MVRQFGLDEYFSAADQPQGLWMTDPPGYLRDNCPSAQFICLDLMAVKCMPVVQR